MSRVRYPRWVYTPGTEPDPRFTLANERTLLAWIRTALALIAGGVALEALALPLQPGLQLAASILLLVLGLIVPLLAWLSWGATERALRESRQLPGTPVAAVLVFGTTAVAVLVLLALLLS